MPMWKTLAAPISLIRGRTAAITATMIRARLNIFRMMSLVMTIWMTTATGVTIPLMGTCGTRTLKGTGHLITQGIGTGSIRGDTRGWMILHGDTRRFTTDAGQALAAAGAGYRDRWRWRQSTLLLWWCLLALAAAGAETLDGSRWVRAKFMFQPMP